MGQVHFLLQETEEHLYVPPPAVCLGDAHRIQRKDVRQEKEPFAGFFGHCLHQAELFPDQLAAIPVQVDDAVLHEAEPVAREGGHLGVQAHEIVAVALVETGDELGLEALQLAERLAALQPPVEDDEAATVVGLRPYHLLERHLLPQVVLVLEESHAHLEVPQQFRRQLYLVLLLAGVAHLHALQQVAEHGDHRRVVALEVVLPGQLFVAVMGREQLLGVLVKLLEKTHLYADKPVPDAAVGSLLARDALLQQLERHGGELVGHRAQAQPLAVEQAVKHQLEHRGRLQLDHPLVGIEPPTEVFQYGFPKKGQQFRCRN